MTMSRLSSNTLSSGVGMTWADFSDSSTGTYTDGSGWTWKYVRYNASGTLNIIRTGYADILIVGGGAGGFNSGSYYFGGGGGGVQTGIRYLPTSAYTITVGAGGASGAMSAGNDSVFGTLDVRAGGGKGAMFYAGPIYNSGGIWGADNGAGSGFLVIGSSAGNYNAFGAGDAGGGINSAITGSTVAYGNGGLAGSYQYNPGDGGAYSQAGNNGVVIVRVRTN